METTLFYILAAVTVVATVFAITEKHAVHAIVYLVTSFFSLAEGGPGTHRLRTWPVLQSRNWTSLSPVNTPRLSGVKPTKSVADLYRSPGK